MGLSSFNRMRRIRAEQAKQTQVQTIETKELEEVFRTLDSYTAQEITDLNAKEQRAFIEQHNLQVDGYKRLTAPELEEKLLEVLGFAVGEGNE